MSRRRPISSRAVELNAPGRCPTCSKPAYGSHADATCSRCALEQALNACPAVKAWEWQGGYLAVTWGVTALATDSSIAYLPREILQIIERENAR